MLFYMNYMERNSGRASGDVVPRVKRQRISKLLGAALVKLAADMIRENRRKKRTCWTTRHDMSYNPSSRLHRRTPLGIGNIIITLSLVFLSLISYHWRGNTRKTKDPLDISYEILIFLVFPRDKRLSA